MREVVAVEGGVRAVEGKGVWKLALLYRRQRK
jgi:hypothetical protein